MKLQIENNLTQDLLANSDLVKKTGSENGSAEVTEMLRKGIKAAQAGDRADARQLLLQATEAEPNNENAWLWLASISEYPEELLIFLSNVLKINPVNERALEWEKSTKSLLSRTFVQRGINAHKDGQGDFARQCFLQAIVHDDQNEMAWLWLASISEAIEEKKSHLQKVLKINPANETALELLKTVKGEIVQKLLKKAQKAVSGGEHEEARTMIADILKRAPETEDAWMLKAHLTDSFSKKIACFEQVLRINPESQEAAASLALMNSVLQKTVPHIGTEQVAEPVAEVAPEPIPEPISEPIPEPTPEQFVEPAPAVEETAVENPEEPDFEMLELEESVAPAEDAQPKEAVQAEATPEPETVEVEEFSAENYFAPEVVAEPEVVADAGLFNESVGEEVQPAAQAEAPFEFAESPAEPEAPVEIFETEPETAESSDEIEFADFQPAFGEMPAEEEVFAVEELLENDPVQIEEEAIISGENAEKTGETSFAIVSSDRIEVPSDELAPKTETLVDCPYCNGENEPQDFICKSCRAMLTLSDLEMLLAHQDMDQKMLERAVERMELEKNLHKFGAGELRSLGIGHINLKNLRKGFEYLQEAVYLNPNDVLLTSQVNSLAIRLSEIEEQQNNHLGMPKNKTILVVDDSPTVRKLISGKLEKCGHEVICAADGMEALEKINEGIPDLILLDITMPRMDGYQVCKLIRGNDATREVPVVMISGKDGFFDKVRGRMAGTTGYITKPFGPETLMKTVETYID